MEITGVEAVLFSRRERAGKTQNVACYYISVAAEEVLSYKFAEENCYSTMKSRYWSILMTGSANANTRHCLTMRAVGPVVGKNRSKF